MTNYFYPPVTMHNDRSHVVWTLGIDESGKLVLRDKYRGTRPLIRADEYTVMEREPVPSWLTGIILNLWLQFAHEDGNGNLNSGGRAALEEAEEALRCAGLIGEDGFPIVKVLTLPAGAGGPIVRKEAK